MQKRKWVYIMKPQAYELKCDLCGGSNIEWSEFEHMIWCYDCEKDTPGNGGIFGVPIPLVISEIFGISFDRIEIATGERLYMQSNEETGCLEWVRRDAMVGEGE